jgi:hypothetical protein
VHYEPKWKYGTTGPRTSVTARLVPSDIAILDALVEAGYGGDIEPGQEGGWLRTSRGAAIRKAIRDAAAAQGVSPRENRARTEREHAVLAGLEKFNEGVRPASLAKSIGLTANQIYRPLGELERDGLARKDGELWFPMQGAL